MESYDDAAADASVAATAGEPPEAVDGAAAVADTIPAAGAGSSSSGSSQAAAGGHPRLVLLRTRQTRGYRLADFTSPVTVDCLEGDAFSWHPSHWYAIALEVNGRRVSFSRKEAVSMRIFDDRDPECGTVLLATRLSEEPWKDGVHYFKAIEWRQVGRYHVDFRFRSARRPAWAADVAPFAVDITVEDPVWEADLRRLLDSEVEAAMMREEAERVAGLGYAFAPLNPLERAWLLERGAAYVGFDPSKETVQSLAEALAVATGSAAVKDTSVIRPLFESAAVREQRLQTERLGRLHVKEQKLIQGQRLVLSGKASLTMGAVRKSAATPAAAPAATEASAAGSSTAAAAAVAPSALQSVAALLSGDSASSPGIDAPATAAAVAAEEMEEDVVDEHGFSRATRSSNSCRQLRRVASTVVEWRRHQRKPEVPLRVATREQYPAARARVEQWQEAVRQENQIVTGAVAATDATLRIVAMPKITPVEPRLYRYDLLFAGETNVLWCRTEAAAGVLAELAATTNQLILHASTTLEASLARILQPLSKATDAGAEAGGGAGAPPASKRRRGAQRSAADDAASNGLTKRQRGRRAGGEMDTAASIEGAAAGLDQASAANAAVTIYADRLRKLVASLDLPPGSIDEQCVEETRCAVGGAAHAPSASPGTVTAAEHDGDVAMAGADEAVRTAAGHSDGAADVPAALELQPPPLPLSDEACYRLVVHAFASVDASAALPNWARTARFLRGVPAAPSGHGLALRDSGMLAAPTLPLETVEAVLTGGDVRPEAVLPSMGLPSLSPPLLPREPVPRRSTVGAAATARSLARSAKVLAAQTTIATAAAARKAAAAAARSSRAAEAAAATAPPSRGRGQSRRRGGAAEPAATLPPDTEDDGRDTAVDADDIDGAVAGTSGTAATLRGARRRAARASSDIVPSGELAPPVAGVKRRRGDVDAVAASAANGDHAAGEGEPAAAAATSRSRSYGRGRGRRGGGAAPSASLAGAEGIGAGTFESAPATDGIAAGVAM